MALFSFAGVINPPEQVPHFSTCNRFTQLLALAFECKLDVCLKTRAVFQQQAPKKTQIRISASTDFGEAEAAPWMSQYLQQEMSRIALSWWSTQEETPKQAGCDARVFDSTGKITSPNHRTGINRISGGSETWWEGIHSSCTAQSIQVAAPVRKHLSGTREKRLHSPKLPAQNFPARLGPAAAPGPGEGTQLMSSSQGGHFTSHFKIPARNIDLEAGLTHCSVSGEQTQMENGCMHTVEPQTLLWFTLLF